MRTLISILLLIFLLSGCGRPEQTSPLPDVSSQVTIGRTPERTTESPPTHTPQPQYRPNTTKSVHLPTALSTTPTTASALCQSTGSILPPLASSSSQFAYINKGLVRIWDVKSKESRTLLLPAWAQDPYPSPDGTRIAFKKIDGHIYQLWMIDVPKGDTRLLITLTDANILQHSPDTSEIDFGFTWSGKHILSYNLNPSPNEIEPSPYHRISYLNVDAGWSQSITIEPINFYVFSPDGNQIALLTDKTLDLIDARTGKARYITPLPIKNWNFQQMRYSPDGKFLVVFTEDGIALIDPVGGTHRMISLNYYHSAPPMPGISWQAEGNTFYTALADQNDASLESKLEAEGFAKFHVWQVDLETAIAKVIATFDGSYAGALFSPDFQYVVGSERKNSHFNLMVNQLSNGNSLSVDENSSMVQDGWNADSQHFFYVKWESDPSILSLRLGSICGTSRALPIGTFANYSVHWITASYAVIIGYAGPNSNGPWSLYLFDINTGQASLIESSTSTMPIIEWSIQ